MVGQKVEKIEKIGMDFFFGREEGGGGGACGEEKKISSP